MKKSKTLPAILTLMAIGMIWWSLLAAAVSGHQTTSWISENPYLESVTKTNGNYNITLAFKNVVFNQKLYNIIINPNSQTPITGLNAYINGTAIEPQAPIACNLQKGDSIQVSLAFPCSNFASRVAVHLEIMGDCFGCGGQIILP